MLSFLVTFLVCTIVVLMPYFVQELRRNHAVLMSYWFVIFLHETVAFINAFIVTTIGAGADAASFQRASVELAKIGYFPFAIGSKFYESMLGAVYWLIEPSHILGEHLSILAFAVSCVVLVKLLYQLDLSRFAAPVVLVFGALPTMFLLGSITLRESFQVLFFMLAVYFGIASQKQGGINVKLVLMGLFALSMGLFHNGLMVYAVFLVVFLMAWQLRPVSGFGKVKKVHFMLFIAIPTLMVVVVFASKLNIAGLGALTALANLDLLESAASYRSHAPISRATYGIALNLESPVTTAQSIVSLYLHYLFSPFPWAIRGVLDLYAGVEAALRFVLLYCSLRHWLQSTGEKRKLLLLMLILFFSMTFLWSMGTLNYGTAIRHHMLSWWILVVCGMPVIVDNFKKAKRI